MKGLILAAGQGQRLRPLTDTCPKPMLPIGDRPLLEHTVTFLARYDVKDLAINLHHHGALIVDHFGDGSPWGVTITYSQEDRLLGTAGAAKRLAPFLADQPFVVIYGDVLFRFDLNALIDFHRQQQAAVTIGLYEVEDPWTKGIVELDDSSRVRRFVEKPAAGEVFSNLANAGIYVMESKVLDPIPPETFCDFGHDVFPSLLAAGQPIYGRSISGYVLDIGSMNTYQQAQRDFAAGRFGQETI